MYFAVIYRPGSAWLREKPIMAQPLQEHFQYMEQIFAQGHVAIGGPFTDNGGEARALVILKAETESEAASLAANDPAVRTNLAVVEVHPWRIMIGGQ